MATTKDSASAPPSTRFVRGIILAQDHFEEITRTAPYIWSVPSEASSSGAPDTYTVNLKHGICSCPDRPPEGERCKHEHAARYVKAKSATCSGCGERFRHSELVEVVDDHDSLTWFPGDLLCTDRCAGNHGVL